MQKMMVSTLLSSFARFSPSNLLPILDRFSSLSVFDVWYMCIIALIVESSGYVTGQN